jgi:hypothetical protein
MSETPPPERGTFARVLAGKLRQQRVSWHDAVGPQRHGPAKLSTFRGSHGREQREDVETRWLPVVPGPQDRVEDIIETVKVTRRRRAETAWVDAYA